MYPMTLRPWSCNSFTTAAALSKRSMSNTWASTLRSIGGPDNCHCQVRPGAGSHQTGWVEETAMIRVPLYFMHFKHWQVFLVLGEHLVDQAADLCQREHRGRKGVIANGAVQHDRVAGHAV